MTLKAILFDVDGTLAETERDGHRLAFNRAFEEAGLDWNWSVPLYGELLTVTGGKERMLFYAQNYRSTEPVPSKETIAHLHQQKNKYYQELLEEGNLPLRPGVMRLIQEALDNDLILAIATTTTPANATTLVKTSLNLDWFKLIAAGDIVPKKKPAPDIYDYTLEQLNLRPEECIAVEDSGNGIKSAIAANLKTIITINDYTKHEDFSKGNIVSSDLGEPDRPCEIYTDKYKDFKYIDLNLIQTIMDS